MKQLLHILKYKFISFIKINTNFSFLLLLRDIGGSAIYILFAFGAYIFSKELIYYLLIKWKLGLFLVHEFFSIVLFIFFVSINVGNIIVSYSTLFKSDEVNYMFSKPIHPTKIFIIKFLDNFFYSSGTLFFVLLAFLLGYADYFEISLFTMLAFLILNILPFILSAASLGIIVLLLILQLSKYFGLKRVVFSIVGIYAVSILVYFLNSSPMKLVNEVLKHYPNVDLYFGNFLPEFVKYMPNQWLASSLYWLVKGKLSFTISFTVLQLCLSMVLSILALYLGDKWYYSSWISLPDLKNKFSKRSKGKISKSEVAVHSKNFSILKKEWLTFFREPSQMIHASVLLFLLLIFISSVSNIPFYGSQNTQIRSLILLSVFTFNIFLISTLALRFIFPIISLEGKASWKVRQSPNNYLVILFIKLIPYLLIIVLLSSLLNLFTMRNFYFEMIMFTWAISFIASITIIILNFSLGALFANYKESNPIRIASSQGASISFLITFFYLIFLVLIMYNSVDSYFEFISRRIRFADIDFIFPLLIISLSSLVTIIVSIALLQKAIKADF
ncbi:MAG: hypothetical protein KKA84_00510 [Bacteroidetes bacterium]|nr:hypothetical protein [Bacteroidota bacterium]